MSEATPEANSLAWDICTGIIYPRLADLLTTSQRYCAWDGVQLSDEQIEQITRALAETSDGIRAAIAGTIDARNARSLIEGLREEPSS
jgi:hypothetical protein